MKKAWMIGLTAVMVVCFGMAQATAATLCVEPTGAMGCFTEVQTAVDAAAPGDKIWVSPGVYYENVEVTTSNITIQGGVYSRARFRAPSWTPADPTLVIIDARPDPECIGTGPGIWIDGAANVTIANLTVRHAGFGGGEQIVTQPEGNENNNIYSSGEFTTLDTVRVLSGVDDGVDIEASNATIRNCYFSGNLDQAIDIEGDNAVVQNNIMYNHGDGSVYIWGMAPRVTGNRINESGGADAIWLDWPDNGTVSNNIINGAGFGFEEYPEFGPDQMEYFWGFGIFIYGASHCTVSNNQIGACVAGGIALAYTNACTVSGNQIDGVGIVGIGVEGGIYGGGVTKEATDNGIFGANVVTNNTVEDTFGPGIGVFDIDPTITRNIVRRYNVGMIGGCYVEALGGAISDNLVEMGGSFGPGYNLEVWETTVSNNVAQFNPAMGFYIYGENNTINNNTARHNGNEWDGGFYVDGYGNTLTGNLAEENPGYGFTIWGPNALSGNTAHGKYRTGIYLAGAYGGTLLLNANVVTNNHGEGIANGAGGLAAAPANGVGNGVETVNIINNIALGNRTDICNNGVIAAFTGNTYGTGGNATPCCLEAPLDGVADF